MIRHWMIILLGILPSLVIADDGITSDDPALSGDRIYIDTSLTPLRESELVDMGLRYSRKMQNLNTNVQIAEYRLKSSGKWDNPEIRIRDFNTEYFKENIDELQFGLRFDFPAPGELRQDKQEAMVELSERTVREIRFRHELAARIREDFADALLRDQLMVLDAKRVELEEKRLAIVEQMVNIGRRSIVYFTKAKMWHAESKNDYARAIQNQVLARRKLAKRTGMDINTPLLEYDIPEVSLELDALIDIAYQNRPEIKLEEQQVNLAIRQNRYERLQTLPRISFIEYNYVLDDRIGKSDWRELRLGIEIPLFDWNVGNIKATNLAVKKKEDAYEAIRETIATEVRSAYIIYRDLLLDWQNFSRDAHNTITEAEKVVASANLHQTLLPDEVLEMELTIVDTKRMLAEKRQELAYALIELCFTLGSEDYTNFTQ